MTAILVFIIATIINVTLSTIRSLCTIKGGKWLSAIANAINFGFYPLIIMLTAKGTVTIIANMAITAIVNFICVWIIKLVEEKARKDKLWMIRGTIPKEYCEITKQALTNKNIPFLYIDINKYIVFESFCETQKQSQEVIDIYKTFKGKMFATENKLSL